MSYSFTSGINDLIWRSHLPPEESSLARVLQATITAQRPHLLEFVKLDEPWPLHAMTLSEWNRPAQLQSLLATYADHLYHHHPTVPLEKKPLLSLWAQWYFGLLVPPLMLALLTQPRALDVSAENVHVEFHESGRVACFWIDVAESQQLSNQNALQRIETLITAALVPVVQTLEATGEIHSKLIWSNTGYLINWYLGEMRTLLGDELVEALRQRCFFTPQLSNGQNNPLWRTMIPREGLLVRRTCCQRNRLPGVQQCGDCLLK